MFSLLHMNHPNAHSDGLNNLVFASIQRTSSLAQGKLLILSHKKTEPLRSFIRDATQAF